MDLGSEVGLSVSGPWLRRAFKRAAVERNPGLIGSAAADEPTSLLRGGVYYLHRDLELPLDLWHPLIIIDSPLEPQC